MNIALTRQPGTLYGIFGTFTSLSGGDPICVTLEHAFPDDNGGWIPKLKMGTYNCIKRESPKFGYDVFMIENPPQFEGHPVTYIEIHRGNWNSDSDGCILLGSQKAATCILESEKAFDAFMELQKDVDSFTLVVS